jgi:hypothetical protein
MDKLTIINHALVATGNTRLDTLADGSDEWLAADSAFERAISFLLVTHKWPFATADAALETDGTSSFKNFEHTYPLPQNCWHLRQIYYEGTAQGAGYELVANVIHAYVSTGLRAYFIEQPETLDASLLWHPAAEEVLALMVEAGLLRSLNEDHGEATSRWNEAELRMRQAAVRANQQTPARNIYRGGMTVARHRRRGC